MKGNRLTRVADLLRQEVADILASRMRDPRMGFVTVTGVEVSPDLGNATVLVSVLASAEEFEAHVKLLNHAAPFVWRELAQRHLGLRRLPQLHFRADHSMEHSQRIQELLREASAMEAPAPEDGSEVEASAMEAPAPGDGAEVPPGPGEPELPPAAPAGDDPGEESP
jgi:ribosome-binding factor A